MELLKECGLDFQRHKSEGIPHKLFAEYLITSGLVFNPNNHWITFHGGTDYGYLLNLLLSCNLPSKSEDFILHIQRVFQNTYDCKEMMKELNLRGGLTKVAQSLEIERIGTMHQGGSDAHLTAKLFFELRKILRSFWNLNLDEDVQKRLKGKISGIATDFFDDDEGYMWAYKADA